MDHKNSQSASYAAAGVDITAGYKAVELMKKHKMDALEGCKMYYHSKAAVEVSNERTNFYKKSAQEIFDLIEAE